MNSTSKDPAVFWHYQAIVSEDDESTAAHKQRLKERVLKYLASKHTDIYLGNSSAIFTSKHGEQILKQLRRSTSTFEYLYCLKFLIKGLEAGIEQLGWSRVVPPSMPLAAPREPARFTPHSFRSLNRLQPLHDAFRAHLEESHVESSPSIKFGLILLSAVLYGGLLDKNWLTPLLRGLNGRVRMRQGLMWVDMQRPYIYPRHSEDEDGRKNIDRRWFPDPLTQGLIIRLHTRYPDLLPQSQKLDALTCLKSIMHNLSKAEKPPSVRELYEGAACYLALRLPSFLVSFASGKTISTSLPSHVWSRILSGQAVTRPTDEEPESRQELPGQTHMINPHSSADMPQQEKLRRKLVSILGESRRGRITCEPTRKKIQEFYNANADRMLPTLQMLCNWSIEMLGRSEYRLDGRKGKNPLQPGAIATYLSAFDQELIACAGRDDISLYDSDELRDLYDDVLKATTSKRVKRKRTNSEIKEKPGYESIIVRRKNHTASFRLTQFHRFLMRAYAAPEIDMGGMLTRKGPPELGVDANMLSPGMFRSALYSLGWGLTARSRLQSVRCFTTILGYRCGLRRHEALAIRIGDLVGEVAPEILVRTSYLNRLKTSDSARRLPLNLLLEPDELKELLHWKQIRIAEEGSDHHINAPLFGAPGTKQLPNDNDLFPEIHTMLRRISGDKGMRFHHLRHSFANRLLLALLKSELRLNSLPEALRQFSDFHIPPDQLARGLFGNMNQGRQFLYGISTLLGHADPSTTFLSYLHISDLLLGQMLRAPSVQPSLSADAIMQITGLKRVMVFRTRAENNCDDWKMELYRERMARHASKLFPDPLPSRVCDSTPLAPQDESASEHTPDWKTVQHTLKLYQVKGMPLEQIASRLRISTDLARAWCTGADAIRNMATKEGTPRHLTAWQRKQQNRLGVLNLFPAPPESKADRVLLDRILKKTDTLNLNELSIVRENCRIFVERYSSNQGYVRFTDLAGAIAYKEFLKLIGVQDSMIYVSMFARTLPGTQSELNHQKEVLKKLGISEDRLLASGKRHVRYRRTDECSVAFMVARTDRAITRKGKQVAAETLYGFRYAIYLLAIGLDCINGLPAASITSTGSRQDT